MVQFANVARPRVGRQFSKASERKNLDVFPIAGSNLERKMKMRQGNIFRSFSQRGDVHLYVFRPKQEVFAKISGGASV